MATPDSNPKTIEIPLTQGLTAVIDECDADLADHKWYAKLEHGYRYYPVRKYKRQPKKLHRFVAERILGRTLTADDIIDHVDNDPLNNRRSNLRLASVSQNTMNQKRSVRNTSGYKGVTWNKRCGKWQASIKRDGKNYHLGLYSDPKEAHEAYKQKAIELHGEFARFE